MEKPLISIKQAYDKTFPHASSSDTPGLAYLPGRGWISSVALMEAKGDPGQSSSERGEDVSVLRLRQKERKTGARRDCAEQASVWHAYRHTDGEMWVHTHSHTHPHRSKDSLDRQLQRCDVHWAWLTRSGCTHKHSLSQMFFPYGMKSGSVQNADSPSMARKTLRLVVYLNSMVSLTFNLTLSLTVFPPPLYLFILDISYMSLHRVHPFFSTVLLLYVFPLPPVSLIRCLSTGFRDTFPELSTIHFDNLCCHTMFNMSMVYKHV